MLTNAQWREILGQPTISEKELNDYLLNLRGFLAHFLDLYLQDEFQDIGSL